MVRKLMLAACFWLACTVSSAQSSQLKKLEYAFNTDPGPGNGTQILLQQAGQLDTELVLDVSGLPTGVHRLFYRVQDMADGWSITQTCSFFKFPGNDNNSVITQLEYFFDTDPGFGNGTPISFQPGNIVSDTFSFPVPDNGDSSRTLYVRAMDNRGAWSLLYKQTIDMCQLFRAEPDFDFINFGNLYTFSDSSHNDPSGSYLWKFFNNNVQVGTSSLSHPQVELPAGLNTVRLIRGTGCRRDSIDRPVTIGKITDYYPKQAEAGADVMLFLYGAGLDENAQVYLKQTANPANSLQPVRKTSHSRQQLALYFDLHGVTVTGSYFIEVIFSNGARDTLDFQLLPANTEEPSITVQLNGPINVRGGIPTLFHITLTNTSNKFAGGVPLYIAVPDHIVLDLGSIPPGPQFQVDQVIQDNISSFTLVDSLFGAPYHGKVYAILLSGINANQTISVPIKLMSPQSSAPAFELHAWTDNRMFGSPLHYWWGKCIDDMIFFALGFVPVGGCFAAAYDYVGNLIDQGLTGYQHYSSLGSFALGFVSAVASCIPGANLIAKAGMAKKVFDFIVHYRSGIGKIFTAGVGGNSAITDCNQTDEENEKKKYIQVGNPKDPNEILGPEGYGPQRYIAHPGKVGYTVSFENIATATAPAQRVYVLDTLDVTKFDLSGFELSHITIGDSIYFIPPSLNKYTQIVKIKQTSLVDVLANIKLDTVTGILSCTMLSVDPVTKELIDPSSFLGFLPPNTLPVNGEGSITYSVKIRNTLPSGTTVSNRAGIVFDTEEPLLTNTWVNTIDETSPFISNLTAERLSDTTARLIFSSADAHSGVRGHRVFMTVNGGPSKFIGMAAPDTLYLGIHPDSAYQFYAYPVDNVGNRGGISNAALITPLQSLTASIQPQALTVSCAADIPQANIALVNTVGTCTGIKVTHQGDAITAQTCEHRYTLTRTYLATDDCGNSRTCTQVITVNDETPPVLIAGTIAGNYPTLAAAEQAALMATNASDNCTGTVALMASTAGSGSVLITVTGTDLCGNTATVTYPTLVGTTPLTVTGCHGNQVRANTQQCVYQASGGEFNVSASGGCTGSLTLSCTLSGATNYSGLSTLDGVLFHSGVTTVTWTATDGCGNTAQCEFTVTVQDPLHTSGYIIYARKEARFGKENDINGDVGVTDANGNAAFKQYSTLDPYKVVAKNIQVQLPASVTNRIYAPATGGPNPPFMSYTGGGLSGNHTQSVSGTVPAGSFKNLTIKQGVTATVHGNNYGKVKIEEGAKVTFTSNSIQIEELEVGKGKKNVNTTDVMFSQSALVRIRDRVKIGEDCNMNAGGPMVTFYLDDGKKDEENFQVKGDNSTVTLNIMIPEGKLKVTGGARNSTMNGWFIAEKIESDGRGTTWNSYECGGALRGPLITQAESNDPKPVKGLSGQVTNGTNPLPGKSSYQGDVKLNEGKPVPVSIYPNPARNVIMVKGPGGPGQLRISDLAGKILLQKTITQSMEEVFISRLLPGFYVVQVQYAESSTAIKLIKQ